ncbi:MAG: sulfurtransferase TusA family protein [Candidatus Bathyarchaeota archaeon]|nr:sulfurtransferase TusA family protein [Candidatus Bathyarchaeota archaeon]
METEKLEVKGKVCPMPILLIKRKLNSVQSGQVLEVIGDCGPAFDNVQRWAKNAGHEVVEASRTGDEFNIKIRKK